MNKFHSTFIYYALDHENAEMGCQSADIAHTARHRTQKHNENSLVGNGCNFNGNLALFNTMLDRLTMGICFKE